MCGWRILSFLLLAGAATGVAPARHQPTGPIWSASGAVVAVVPCGWNAESDEHCRAVEVRRGGKVERAGEGYMTVTRLWRCGPGESGPDLLLRGDSGGSGGLADLIAITVSPGLEVRRINMAYADAVTAGSEGGVLRFDAPFAISYFNGAPNSSTTVIPLPIRWIGGDFALDLGALTGRSFSPGDLRFRELAVRVELRRWASDEYPSPRLFPPEARAGTPVTVHALLDLMLAGRADQARDLLDRTWPRAGAPRGPEMGGKDAFWSALCRAVIENQEYKRFRLSRLPHAALIEAGAAGAK